MHREKQILLGFLGLLCGGFVAVLGAKLFIPRPPAGAGPDIDAPPAIVAPQLVVEPPALSAAVDRQAAARPDSRAPDPRSDDPPPPAPPPASFASDRYADAGGSARRDDLVAPAAFLDEPADASPVGGIPVVNAAAAPPPDDSRPAEEPDGRAAPADEQAPIAAPAPPITNPFRSRAPPAADRPAPLPTAAAVAPSAPLRDELVTAPGDSWWAIAERAYGEGRYYRALYAWNRTVNPQVSLLPGTRLEIPPVSRLEAAWPKLVPQASAVGSPRGAD